MSLTVAAIDLGAESGRVTTVRYDGTRLHLDVVHRFVHAPFEADGVLRWDLDHLWDEIRRGLALLDAGPEPVASVGVDAWGVDYGLLTTDGRLVDQPTCYRDPRNIAAMERALAHVGAAAMYGATGVQIMPINTVFSLVSDVADHPGRLAAAATLLMLPDVLHHLLSGSTVTEYTAASTTGLFDIRTGAWAGGLLDELGIPGRLMPEVAPPGTDVGALLGGWTGALRDTRVVLPPAHDTASAVVGTPLEEHGSVFISSGTWSLVGVETGHPVVTDASRRQNLTNEGGYDGTTRLLRNVMGLWILQNCRRQWAHEGQDLSYQEIAELAGAEPGQVSVIDPDAHEFLAAGDMPRRIQEHCSRLGLPVPQGIGAVARCVVDSLAARYADVVDAVTDVTGTRPPAVNIVGGGASHALLSQLTADATGLPVRCGPVEATALGNAAVQLVAAGELAGLADIRRVVAASTDIVEYLPQTVSTQRTPRRDMPRNNRTTTVTAIGVAALLAVSGCTKKNEGSSSTASGGSGSSKKYQVAFVPKLQGIPYFEAMNAGGKKAEKDLGNVTWLYQGPTSADAAAQAQIVRSFIQRGVDSIFVAPNDPNSMSPVLQEAKAKKIQVATSDTDAPDSVRQVFVSQASTTGIGEGLTDQLMKAMGGKGKYAIVSCGETAENLNSWIKVQKAYAAKKYPKAKLVSVVYAGEDQSKATQMATDLMNANPDLTGLVGECTSSAPGVAQAVKDADKIGKVFTVGLGTPKSMAPYLKSGSSSASILWDVEQLGYLTAWAGSQLAAGKSFAPSNKVNADLPAVKYDDATKTLLLGDPLVITKKNVGQFNY